MQPAYYALKDYDLSLSDGVNLMLQSQADHLPAETTHSLLSGQALQIRLTSQNGAPAYEIRPSDHQFPNRLRYEIERFDGVEFEETRLIATTTGEYRNPRQHVFELAGAGIALQAVLEDGEYFLDVRTEVAPVSTPLSLPTVAGSESEEPLRNMKPLNDHGGYGKFTVLIPPRGLYGQGDGGVKPALHAFLRARDPDGLLLIGVLKVYRNRLVETMEQLGISKDEYRMFESGDRRATHWVRDPLIVRVHDQEDLPLGSYYLSEGSEIMEKIMKSVDYRPERAGFPADGGNLICGDDRAFIGKNDVVAYAVRQRISLKEATEALKIRLGLGNLMVIGTASPLPPEVLRELRGCHPGQGRPDEFQPHIHLDMFMAYPGANRSGQQQVLLGDPKLAHEIGGEPILSPSQALCEVFREIEADLEALGFLVHRIPLPLMEGPHGKYFASPTNVLMARSDALNTIWLPCYGKDHDALARTDQAAINKWREVLNDTSTIHQVSGMKVFAERQGALRCITNVIHRLF